MTEKIVTQCSVEGCEIDTYCRGFCKHHYHVDYKVNGATRKNKVIVGDNCQIEGCDKLREKGKAYCGKHYWRTMRYGDPNHSQCNIGEGATAEDRFWSRVAITANPDKCWEWQGLVDGPMGYGKTQITTPTGKIRSAHRVAYYLVSGVMPKLHILHSCDNPKCVNPNHLREGTSHDNKQDAVSRGRHSRGEKVNTCKLTESQVHEIRYLMASGETARGLAERFPVEPCTIRKIHLRKSWRHI